MARLFVIKIGGNVIDREENLRDFLRQFSKIQGKKILIHGGGSIATRIGDALGIQSKYHKGRRITDKETLDLVTMVYGGLVNKQMVAQLQQLGVNAIGLTGADGNAIHATRRPAKEIDFGLVGDLSDSSVNRTFLFSLLEQELVPVLAPLTYGDGTILNTNADTIAQAVAVALSARHDVRLIYCFDKTGVLRDVNQPDSVITKLNTVDYQNLLASGALHDGILPKLENAFEAIGQGVKEVLIGDAENLLKNTSSDTLGTLITA
ncbi:MAG: acetylglutamate kinase [Bacteroidetes bacterium]|nr:acetylglutamate kinase [Bacteroidota bacterium]